MCGFRSFWPPRFRKLWPPDRGGAPRACRRSRARLTRAAAGRPRRMIGAMARPPVQVLRAAGKTLQEAATAAGVSRRRAQRIEREPHRGRPSPTCGGPRRATWGGPASSRGGARGWPPCSRRSRRGRRWRSGTGCARSVAPAARRRATSWCASCGRSRQCRGCASRGWRARFRSTTSARSRCATSTARGNGSTASSRAGRTRAGWTCGGWRTKRWSRGSAAGSPASQRSAGCRGSRASTLRRRWC